MTQYDNNLSSCGEVGNAPALPLFRYHGQYNDIIKYYFS